MRETRLDSVLALRSGGLPAPLVAWLVARVADEIAHQPRILTTAEVRVREDGEVRLVRRDGPAPFSSRAPEVVRGGDGDVRAAVFALGVMLVECALGRSPFHGATDLETRLAVGEDPTPKLAGRAAKASATLDAIVQRSTAKDPRERHGSAEELRDELDTYLEDELHEVGPAFLAAAVRDAIEMSPSDDRTSMPDFGASDIEIVPDTKRSSHPNKPKFLDESVVRLDDPLRAGAGAGVTEVSLTGVRESGPHVERPAGLDVDDAAIHSIRENTQRTLAPTADEAPTSEPNWLIRIVLVLVGLLVASVAYQYLLRPLLTD